MKRQDFWNFLSCLAICSVLVGALPGVAAAAEGRKWKTGDQSVNEWVMGVQRARHAVLDVVADAAGGVDGVKKGGIGFHTNNDDPAPWWQVDLGAEIALDRVVVFNRLDFAPERAGNLVIQLSNDAEKWTDAYSHDGTVFYGVAAKKPLVASMQGKAARYVRLTLAKRDYLHLDEIEIYAQDDKEKNVALFKPATQSSISSWSTRAAQRLEDLEFTSKDVEIGRKLVTEALDEIGEISTAEMRERLEALSKAADSDDYADQWADLYVTAAEMRDAFRQGRATMEYLKIDAVRRAIEDLSKTFPDQYTDGDKLLAQLGPLEKSAQEIGEGLAKGDAAVLSRIGELQAFQRHALLANPLLDFDKMLIVRRANGSTGLPANWQGNCAMGKTGYDNQIAVLSPVGEGAEIATLFEPKDTEFVGDVDLHFDAQKMLFSMPGSHGCWQIWEVGIDGQGLRQVTPGEYPDVDNYDACYLPNGRIMFGSTRCFHGVPCVGGGNTVANLCLMDDDGSNIRQLTFDQDHNWYPALLNNGRVLYTRWEYSDTSHYFTRVLFSMNPDGTNQLAYYGSNSYWPNSMFYARPIPGDPTKVATIVSGHHGVARIGELLILDPAKGRHEADGVVQRIPGYGQKVEPIIRDTLVDDSWPKFLHPYPLSENYYLVSMSPKPGAPWGIYLADVFDNLVLIKEEPGYQLFEPVPLRKTERPPVIPDRVNLESRDATVYMTDVYAGQGLAGVPRGTVKSLRIYEFHYAYPQMGGHINIAIEGTWDVHRIVGTVPVAEDGSALFTVPANTPLAVQPLDSEGRAVQVMRSWFTAMPGENLSCVGCHEGQNTTPAPKYNLAARRVPSEIKPWYGPTRGFSFAREVQEPVLEKYCTGCHNDKPRKDGKTMLDFTKKEENGWGNFTPAYLELHRFVRRPGPESDYHIGKPMEYHTSTSELIQMLKKGHHGVELDAEAWDRLYTWIDLNVPDHGTWREHRQIASNFHERRLEMRTRYANRPEDPEAIPEIPREPVEPIMPQKPAETQVAAAPKLDDWPFGKEEAAKRQSELGPYTRRTIDLGEGVTMDLVLVPAGEFVMGNANGFADERPQAVVKVSEPFWMGVGEVTNAQFQRFRADHDNGFIDQQHKDHTTPGYPMQAPDLPAMRLTWDEAVAFTQWLSQKAGVKCALPTEAQWEWACRAGTATPFFYGDTDSDFSPYANLADISIQRLAVSGVNPQPISNPDKYVDWMPQDARFNDENTFMTKVGQYAANPWGLKDMHGNVWEWTRSEFRPYPYSDEDGRNDLAAQSERVVRGGSWIDRPKRANSSVRLAYEPWQKVWNVGFRIAVEADTKTALAASK